MSRFSDLSPTGLRIIGVYKLVKAAAIICAGVAVIRLRPNELVESLVRLAARLRFDPDDRLIHSAISRLSGLGEGQLEAIGAGMVLYGLLYVVQGVGLLLLQRWAEYLVVVTTGFLIPVEAYEVATKGGAVRALVLLINLAIVAYLVNRLRREEVVEVIEHRSRPGPDQDPKRTG
jgi:uncharacterized membrane protein (DUF2068 family)